MEKGIQPIFESRSDLKSELDDLRKVCREQLHIYPDVSKNGTKQRLIAVGKRILLERKLKADKYFWPNSLLAIALEHSYTSQNDPRDLHSLISYYEKWINSGLQFNKIDNTMNGYSLIYIFEKTNDSKYKKAIDTLANYLFDFPRDKHGSLPYRDNGTNHIFVDSMGMICPFLCRYGELTNNQKYTELAITQLINYLNYGIDEKTLLPYHGYNADSKYKLGIIGWGRAVGWLMIGMIDSLGYIDPNNNQYDILVESFIKIANSVVNYQNHDGYFSWQLEAVEGHVDTSSTSMIAYAVRRAITIGILDKSFLYNTNLALSALLKSTNKGIVGDCSAECKGLSIYPQKYDSFPWAQGPATALLSLSIE